MDSGLQLLNRQPAAEKRGDTAGHFRSRPIPDTQTIIFFFMLCPQVPERNVQCVCVCVYSNYIVCLSRTIAVPVFVAPQGWNLPGMTALPSSDRKRFSHNANMRVCVAPALIVEYANVCTEYQMELRPQFRRRSLLCVG